MNFPLELRFKLLALASQIYVRDAHGALVGYVRQKMFKLKEDVVVYGDEQQTQPRYRIRADRIIDIAAEYEITEEATGAQLGWVKRRGMRSFWRAEYDIRSIDGGAYTVREESVLTRVFDNLLGQVPFGAILSGYLFHPAYCVTRNRNGSQLAVMRVVKARALFEGRFRVEPLAGMTDGEKQLLVLSALMMLLLERQRG